MTYVLWRVGHDWCIIKLAFPGRVVGVDVDTSFFTGNHSPRMSIQAICLEDEPVSTSWFSAPPTYLPHVMLYNVHDDHQVAFSTFRGRRQDPGHPFGKMGTCASPEDITL